MPLYGYSLVFFLKDTASIGVRAVYKDGDNTTYSEIATCQFRETGRSSKAEKDGSPLTAAYGFTFGASSGHPHKKIKYMGRGSKFKN